MDLFLLPCTDETNLPSDIPSYLSSQGTLAERQDGYVPSESGSNYQYVSSSMGGFYLQPKDMKGKTPGTRVLLNKWFGDQIKTFPNGHNPR